MSKSKTKTKRLPQSFNRKNKKATLEDVLQIVSKFQYLQLVKYSGSMSKPSLLFDRDYGMYQTRVSNLKQGYGKHPDRLRYEQTPEYWKKVREKTKQTNIKRYGVENVFQNEKIKEKIKKTNLERYGYESAIKNKEIQLKVQKTNIIRYGSVAPSGNSKIKEKAKQTNIKRYGVEFPGQSKKIQAQIIQTNLKKYGVKYNFLNEDVKQKIKITNLKKYGVENPLLSTEVQKKVACTNLYRYGVSNVFESKEIKDKIKQTNIKKYGVDNPQKNKTIKEKVKNTNIRRYGVTTYLLTKEGIKNSRIASKARAKKYDGKTVTDISKELGRSSVQLYRLVSKYGFEKALSLKKFKSYLEVDIENYLTSIKVEYLTQYRIDGLVADIFIPSKNLIIELNGNYWHSDKFRDKKYHKSKKDLYLTKGLDSLFFREDEVKNKFGIVTSIINNKLNYNFTNYHARQCEIELIPRLESKQFFNDNHIMGVGKGKTYGLFYKGDLVSAMSVVKKSDYLEIDRFCNKLNSRVRGSFSKLLNFSLQQENSINFIRSFVDMRYGNGLSLEKVGFMLKKSYISFKWIKPSSLNVYNRMKFPSNSGYNYGLFKLWDCGQLLYEKVL